MSHTDEESIHNEDRGRGEPAVLTPRVVRASIIAVVAESVAILACLWAFDVDLFQVPPHTIAIWALAFAVVFAIQIAVIAARARTARR